MRNKIIVWFSICCITWCSNALAQSEQILNFVQHILVNRDASIEITEKISVYAQQEKIIHGIKRELPLRYTDSYGIDHYGNFQIEQILLNGKPSPYHVEREDNNLVIYIGDKEVTLAPGIYHYTIQYHVDDAVNFLQDADELYWNITGNTWRFPIARVEALIQLPQSAQISNYAGYTGTKGEKEKKYIANKIAANQIQFTTTEPLATGEGLTIAVAWQKEIIKQPLF